MGAGFQSMRQGEISVYHYQIVLYLAWLSSSVHLSALTLLRPYLNERPGIKFWRLAGMVVLLIMLLVGLVPTVSYDWGIINPGDPSDTESKAGDRTGWGIPAVCFWGRTYEDGVNNDAPIGYLILVVSYVWKVGDIFPSARRAYTNRLRKPAERGLQKPLMRTAERYVRTRQMRHLICFRMLLILYLPFFAFLEVLASFTASLWLSALGLVFGTLQIIIPRNQNIARTGSQEDQWGFGQLVPLILLVQPLGAILEHLWIVETGSTTESISDHLHKAGRGHPMTQINSSGSAVRTLAASPLSPPHDSDDKKMSLIDVLGREEVSVITAGHAEHYHGLGAQVILSSRLFATIVALLHLTVLGGACFIFYLDVESIGYARGGSWPFVLVAVAVYVVGSWTLLGLLCPSSRLGRGIYDR